jgi:hypothetical protein
MQRSADFAKRGDPCSIDKNGLSVQKADSIYLIVNRSWNVLLDRF